jgi:hypothetical protein
LYQVRLRLLSTTLPLVCLPYNVFATQSSPLCAADAPPCSLPHCFSTRECPKSASDVGCDTRINRCIEGGEHEESPHFEDSHALAHRHHHHHHDDDDDDDGLCHDAQDGAPCILHSNASVFDCFVGKCQSEHCVNATTPVKFQCDCLCPPQCNSDNECNDNNQHTDDFCILPEHQCVFSPKIVPRTTTHATATPSPAPPTTNGSIINGTLGDNGTLPFSVVGFRSHAVTQVASEHDRLCLLITLDSAERAYAAGAMDRFGAFAASGERLAPLSGGATDLTQSIRIYVDSRLGVLENSSCCGDKATRLYCLDGMPVMERARGAWLDRAFLALDAAHRAAQAGSPAQANRDACCAAMIYEQMGAADGRDVDRYGLNTAIVERVEEHSDVGARCINTDDGHPDDDLNDFIFEMRRVDLYCNYGHRLCAINIHTLPLAHGGGFRTSLVLATGGNGNCMLSPSLIVDNNDALGTCTPRLKAAMPIDAARAFLTKSLGCESAALPDGSFAEVAHHALRNGGLPSQIATSISCSSFGVYGSTACPHADVATLYANTRWPLPLTHPDALERLTQSGGAAVPRYREPTSNTQRGTRRVRALYAVSTTVVVAPLVTTFEHHVDYVHLVLRNEDCGMSILIDSLQLVGDKEVPMAVSVPAAACPSWRWADEGAPLVRRPESAQRMCRGGDDSALVECSVDYSVCAVGGTCELAPAQGGVAYPDGWQYFQCLARGVQCDQRQSGGDDAACCTDAVREWYKNANAELLYSEEE